MTDLRRVPVVPRQLPPLGAVLRLVLLLSALLFSGVVCRVVLAQADGQLPWDDAQNDSQGLPPRQLLHPSELLELFGIAESQLKMLADGEALGANDEETLIRLLYQMPRFPLNALQRWAAPRLDVDALVAAPADHRSDAVRLVGRAKRVRQVTLAPEIAGRFEFSKYYIVTIESGDPPCLLEVCTRAIPKLWKTSQIDEPVSAFGLFLKTGASDAVPTLIFVAPRVAWHPDRIDEEKMVAADHLVLANLGMDIGLFDAIRERNRKGIENVDSECFYQLLAAVGRAKPGQLAQAATYDPPFGPLLQLPRSNQGKLFSFRGTARRVTRILVGEKNLQERFGFDHYYQIDIFVSLDGQVVRLGDPSASSEDVPTFSNNYPITVCTRQLPPGMQEGEDLRQEVRVAAVYFKLWSYRSEYISSFDNRQLQISPMLIGRELELIEIDSAQNPWLGVIAGFMFLAFLGLTWYGLWRSGRIDRRFEQEAKGRRTQLDKGQSLNDINVPDGPDFSNLG